MSKGSIRMMFSQISLRQKLIHTSIACLVIPTICMLTINNIYSKLIIREHTVEKATQSLMVVQSQVNGILEEMVSILNFVQFDPEIKTLLEEAKTSPIAGKKLTTRLEQIAGEKDDLRITLLTDEGYAYSDYSFYDFEPQLFLREAWFQELKGLTAYDTYFLGDLKNYLPVQSPDEKRVFLTARALTEGIDKPPFAYLIVSRTEPTINKLFRDMEEEVSLLDSDNSILFSRNSSWIGVPLTSIMTHQVQASPAIIELDGENQIYISLPLQYADWKIISLAPYQRLTGKLNKLSQTGIMLQALFVIGFLVALTYLLRRFTRPVKTLGEAAKRVEAGDLSHRSNIRGPDEIGRLGRSFDFMLDRIQEMLEQIQIEQELKRKVEMAMLRAQVHPHFLFNVLSSIRLKLLMQGDEETAMVVGSLSSLLRATLSEQNEFISLYAELEMTKQYMELMRFTMKFPIDFQLNIHVDMFSTTVPRFILQPIIENAYKHGFTQKGGNIVIDISKVDSQLCIKLEDNGLGIPPDKLAQLIQRLKLQKEQVIEHMIIDEQANSFGIGLYNVYSRLKLLFGERFDMNIESHYGERTVVQLLLPIEHKEVGDEHV